MNGALRRAALYARTVAHLRPQQVAWRLVRAAQRRLPVRPPVGDGGNEAHFDKACLQRLREFLATARRHGLDADADPLALRDDLFTFLNRTVDCEPRIPWQDASLPRLWRYQLHGFRMVRMLASSAFSDSAALGDAAHAARWVEDWFKHNPAGADVAWDAHPTAERIFNWVLGVAAFGAGYGATAARCAGQAAWLESRLEHDVRANHLLKESMALALVAEATGVGDGRRAWARVEEQVSEQILPDGGHYERSPMYHAQALFDGLVLRAAAAAVPGFFDNALRRMTHFLEDILHPDGDIPLFGDAALGETMPGGALAGLAREVLGVKGLGEARTSLPDTGYYVLGGGAGRMILKAAGPSPAYQPGHAHGDPFSFELSVAGRRLIVDGGCHGYAESDLRGYCRSVASHNTVRINGAEPMEAWAVFRVARRHRIVSAEWEMSGHASILRGVCRWPQGWTQTRHVRHDRDSGFWVVVDRVDGGDPLMVESFLHFHPDTELTEKEGAWIARLGDARLGILPEGADRVELVEGCAHRTRAGTVPGLAWRRRPRRWCCTRAARTVSRADGCCFLRKGRTGWCRRWSRCGANWVVRGSRVRAGRFGGGRGPGNRIKMHA